MIDSINAYFSNHPAEFRMFFMFCMISPFLFLAAAYNCYNACCSFIEKRKGRRHD